MRHIILRGCALGVAATSLLAAAVAVGLATAAPVTAQDTCPTSVTRVAVTKQVAARVFDRSHVSEDKRKRYVIAAVVPIELGGTKKLANLTALRRTDVATHDAAVDQATTMVCQGLVDREAAAAALRADWRGAPQALAQAGEQRKVALAQYLAAERQRILNEYLASLPPPTTAPRVPKPVPFKYQNCHEEGATATDPATGRLLRCHLTSPTSGLWLYSS